jgi:hypothetical protein
MLGAEIIYSSAESVYLATPNGIRMGFDRTPDFTAPRWSSDRPPLARIDVATADLPEAERRLLGLGATRPGNKADTDQWIFMADPEGHPFCVTTVF